MNNELFERLLCAALTGICANPELAESSPSEWAQDAYATACELTRVVEAEASREAKA